MEKHNSILSPIQATRDPAIWDEGMPDHPTMVPMVKGTILDGLHEILTGFTEEYGDYIVRVYIIGSITGFQYDVDADVDVNYALDIDSMAMFLGVDPEDLRASVRKANNKFNGKPVPGTAHPVNYFLQTDETMPPADGIYDLLEDTWIKYPEDPISSEWDPYDAFGPAIERAEQLAERIDVKWGVVQREMKALERYPEQGAVHKRKILRQLRALKRIFETLHEERQEVFELAKKNAQEPPQGSTPNVVYKYLEWGGELDTLHTAIDVLNVYSDSGELDF